MEEWLLQRERNPTNSALHNGRVWNIAYQAAERVRDL